MTGPKTRPLPTVGKQACDRLLSRLIRNLRRLTELCDKVESALAKKLALEDAKKVEIHLKLTRLLSEGQYSIKTLGKLQQSPNWISDVEGHLNTMMHVQEATDNIRLIQEPLRQLRELSLADIDTSTPQDLDQATVDEDFSETQAGPTVQQRWAPQYPTQAGSTSIASYLTKGLTTRGKLARERSLQNAQQRAQTIPTPEEMPANGPDWYQASNDNVHASRRARLLTNARNRAQTIPSSDEMPPNGPDWYQASNDNVHASRRARLLTNARNRAQTIPTSDEMPPNGPDWYQASKTLVNCFLEPADLHLDMDTPRNLSSSAKRSFDAFRRVRKSPQQQMNQSHVVTSLFRDRLQRHRKPRSPEELQENFQDAANVPIDTIAYRKNLPVHHNRYLKDSQAVKRHKGSEPTEPSITASTAAEMIM
ncbi:hypothetical protein SARC_01795 [Sphaeroforma arctica JP610]|uniref:Uncharacterized protein n=1 Tax=Sphaeroforma arctica JP610 TaxID=667725 RepID=A0A0L0GAW5_9EUKA|nr:hypothetical protein SARC_01795 [Sphaeroforma arctica JP610]KNC86036.1 hypothetical protein SARC_01795 [Sphaeroforma arctica JP610]|eukprot:XP_014159938.1 hypothetical protein SARC_01795 [Sphaeroforma arctica JP610]